MLVVRTPFTDDCTERPMGNDELGQMKKSHLAVEHAMDAIIEVMAEIEETSSLDAELRGRLEEKTDEMTRRILEHLEKEEQAARVTERLFSGRPLDVEDLGRQSRQMEQVARQFEQAVDELQEDTDVDDDAWGHVRQQFGELVDVLRSCSMSEWEFYRRYSTLLQPGGLSA